MYTPRGHLAALALLSWLSLNCGGQAVDGTEFGDSNGIGQNSNDGLPGSTDTSSQHDAGQSSDTEASFQDTGSGEAPVDASTEDAAPGDTDSDDVHTGDTAQSNVDTGDVEHDDASDTGQDTTQDDVGTEDVGSEDTETNDTALEDTTQDDVGEDVAPDAPVEDPLALLGDDFEGEVLDGWSIHNPNAAQIFVQDGQLRLEPAARSVWFQGDSGSMVWKNVEGNFRVSAYASARRISDPSALPTTRFRLGGVIARNPDTSQGENYVFVVIGADDNDVSVETKTTVNSVSTYTGPPWPSGEGELRICRVGATFRLYIRERGGAWQLQATYTRDDLPPTLQVGALAYANTENPDFAVSYEAMTFASIEDAQGCTE